MAWDGIANLKGPKGDDATISAKAGPSRAVHVDGTAGGQAAVYAAVNGRVEQEGSRGVNMMLLSPGIANLSSEVTASVEGQEVVYDGQSDREQNYAFLHIVDPDLANAGWGLKPYDELTLSQEGMGPGVYLQINCNNSEGNEQPVLRLYGNSSRKGSATFKVPHNFESVSAVYLGYTAGCGHVNGRVRLQLERGAQATAWEPYTGMQPAPNPEYPRYIEKACFGKENLWRNTPGGQSGISVAENGNGSCRIWGTATANAIVTADASALPTNRKYTISLNRSIGYNADSHFAVGIGRKESRYDVLAAHNGKKTQWLYEPHGDYMGLVYVTRLQEGDEAYSAETEYRVRLVEGEDRYFGWSAPGTSVEPTARVALYGRNLVDPDLPLKCGFSRDGEWLAGYSSSLSTIFYLYGTEVECPAFEPGKRYYMACDAQVSIPNKDGNAMYLQIVHTDGSMVSASMGGTAEGTVHVAVASTEGKDVARAQITYGYPTKIRLKGLTVAEYAGDGTPCLPASVSSAQVELPCEHPYLAALPDGTCDRLEMTWDGLSHLVCRVGRVVLDGGEDWGREEGAGWDEGCFFITPGDTVNTDTYTDTPVLCNLTGNTGAPRSVVRSGTHGVAVGGVNRRLYLNLTGYVEDIDGFKAFLAKNPCEVLYPLGAPVDMWFDGDAWSKVMPLCGSVGPLRVLEGKVTACSYTGVCQGDTEVHALLEGGEALGVGHDLSLRVARAVQ